MGWNDSWPTMSVLLVASPTADSESETVISYLRRLVVAIALLFKFVSEIFALRMTDRQTDRRQTTHIVIVLSYWQAS